MSARTYMLSLESLEPIQQAIGSHDEALLAALLKALDDDEDFQSYAKDMIMTSPPPSLEPGCWNYLVEPLAAHFGLSPQFLPLDDWKHYHVWEEYRSVADTRVSEQSRALLKCLEEGRPFLGSGIDPDGCTFAWLMPDEAASLHSELSVIDAEDFAALEAFDEFHEELVEALGEAVEAKTAVFVGAH